MEVIRVPKYIERDPVAREEWDRVVEELVDNRLLTRANLGIFGAYCAAFAEWMHAADEVEKDGRWLEVPIVNKKGDIVGSRKSAHPGISQAQKARIEMRLHAQEFGMTPASATKVQAEPPAEEKNTDFADLIAGNDDAENEGEALRN